MHLLLYYECLCDQGYLQLYMLIYRVVVPPISICAGFLLVSYYGMLYVLVVHIQIIYYNHNKMQGAICLYSLAPSELIASIQNIKAIGD